MSRYPQSNDLIKWLSTIPNHYLHFGDFDFAGINIYQKEFKKHLDDRATFFMPENTELLLLKFGNRDIFNRQYNAVKYYSLDTEKKIKEVIRLMLKYKKALEQEVFINQL